jgi:hypothetical protein
MAFATIGTKGITDAAIATDDIADNAVTSGKIAGGVIPASRPNAQPLIINGDMAVAQRGTSTGITTAGYYACDRFQTAIGNLATWTISQDSDVPSGYGFANSLKLDCTTADASPNTGEVVIVRQRFEGQDVQLLKKGTSSAEKVTVAFWIKATKTGTNILELFDRDNSRTISQSYTISSSNTWEYKVINFSADTTGVLDDDNNLSFEIAWWLASGTDYTSGTLQTSWGSQTDADRAVGQVNHGDSTSNNVFITGVQMEVGEYTSSSLPPFQHESFGDNLARCQRYYHKVAEYGADGLTNQTIGMGYYKSTSQWRILCYLPVRPRTNPSLDSTSGTNYYINDLSGIDDTFNGVELTRSNSDIVQVVHTGSNVSGTVGQAGESVAIASGAYIAFNAEL